LQLELIEDISVAVTLQIFFSYS